MIKIAGNIRKYKKFFNTEARKFHFSKWKTFFLSGFLLFFWAWDQKVAQVALYITTRIKYGTVSTPQFPSGYFFRSKKRSDHYLFYFFLLSSLFIADLNYYILS